MAGYTVSERGGCRVVVGQMPVTAFMSLSSEVSGRAVLDPHLARLLGATLAIGDPEALDALRRDPEVLQEARDRVASEVRGLSPEAAEWYATGERGLSSDAMFYAFTGVGKPSVDAPSDPDDLRRCRLLLEQVPGFLGQLERMREISAHWARLVDEWAVLTAQMDEECPDWRSSVGAAPQTYKAMKDLAAERVAG
ncbi:hypothetical protein [Burkholderia vietnamiensis]|uniref:hypothetical protein n=1 Tax=Burkholderia vietnamiensis TaxID=60552 RepID=UPI001CF438F0|nr:hypothetical protein [Burkholderia vietnamiensis]MCA8228247.1 hypothetical protein [Burkholderia vietnamiensis]